ncbi:MAG TPA: gamma-glutamyl-gamma-aminobutyrate hydrolase family protein, partial [Thermoanaerobaculia bacterium]|nr:gamma-glutamyl-gamma-aminobutyrate hydrolase family protein [Thermoanaerobaculia bacterium]
MRKPIIGVGSDVYTEAGHRDRAFVYTTYVESLRRAGAVPVLIPPQPENAADVVEELDGLVLAGGEDCDPATYGEEKHPTVEPMDPRRQENDLALARAARERGIPTLGICLGLQMMNVAAGGTLIQDIDTQHDTDIRHASEPENRARHSVIIEGGTNLGSILSAGEIDVNSSHHQAIKDLGEGLRVTAHAPDGIIEGLEDPAHPFYIGVQWHPEDMPGESTATSLLGAFVEAARQHAAARLQASTELSPALQGNRN